MPPSRRRSARRAFIDTGAWYAYFVGDDEDHGSVTSVLEDESLTLVTSSYVFDEVITLIAARLHHEAARQVGSSLRDPSIVEMEWVTVSDEKAAWQRFRQRSDKSYSFTDCTSFVIMHRLGLEHVLTTDADFDQEGYVNLLRDV